MKNKAILVYAFLSNNLGDDIFVKMLCERYQKQKFIISSEGSANKTLRSIPNLQFSILLYFLNKLTGLERKLRDHMIDISIFSDISRVLLQKYETAVYIAGSIFVQKSEKFLGNDTTLRNRHLIHKNFFIIGANFGPFKDRRYRDVVENQFNNVTDVCFRDSASKKFFENMPNVRWAPDVVFGLKHPIRVPQKKIVISVIKCNRKGRPDALATQTQLYEIVLTEVCAILSQLGYSICLMSFCEKQGDGETTFNIKNRCLEAGIRNVSEFHYNGNIDEALNIIAECERVIATRFHMMILGWVMEKPVYPLIYDQKMKRVLEDTGFFKGKEIIGLMRTDAREIVNSLLELNPVNCESLRVESENQFAGLDRCIMEKNNVNEF